MKLEDLEAEALKLDASSRARLAERILGSLETLSDAENERLWTAEALRRHEELESGMATSRPAEDVFREAHERLA